MSRARSRIRNKLTFVDFDTWMVRYSPDIADVPASTAPTES